MVDAREAVLESVEATEEWEKLSDDEWLTILERHRLGPVPELVVGNEDALLETLAKSPLSTWEDLVVSVPAHMQKAREEAAKRLMPEAVTIEPKHTTLYTAAETDAYLTELKTEILEHVDAGKPVIL